MNCIRVMEIISQGVTKLGYVGSDMPSLANVAIGKSNQRMNFLVQSALKGFQCHFHVIV
jgi:hypothetical protein